MQRIEVEKLSPYDLPSNMQDLIIFLNKKMEEIPEKYRKAANIDFDMVDIQYTDDQEMEITISYTKE